MKPVEWIERKQPITNGEPIRVYRNLNRKCWSVQARVDGAWKVVGWARLIIMRDVNFKVSRAGADRVRRDKRKNVHAYCEGKWVDAWLPALGYDRWRDVSYDPYTSYHFTDPHGNRMDEAEVVICTSTGRSLFPLT